MEKAKLSPIRKGETGKQYARRLINFSTKESKEKAKREFLDDLRKKAKHSYLWQRILINIEQHYGKN